MSDLRFIVLSNVVAEPGTGYDVHKKISAHWKVSHQGVYRCLRDMHKEGLLTMDCHPSETSPDRKVYQATQAGRDKLTNEEATPIDISVDCRGALLARLMAPTDDDIKIKALRTALGDIKREIGKRIGNPGVIETLELYHLQADEAFIKSIIANPA